MLIPQVIGALAGAPAFGAAGGWLPSFVHPFGFALLTAAALPASSAWRYGGCAAWGAANVALELGQHPALARWWLDTFEPGVALSPLGRYLLHGTFDVRDLVAASAGALAAAAVLRILGPSKKDKHAH